MFDDYIPIDKSWTMRMGLLDLLNEESHTLKVLAREKELGDDLLALRRCIVDWKSDRSLEVGESGTLYRFLQFASWKLNLNKQFVLTGSLKDRHITQNPDIVRYPLAELLTLDNGTSQWASAAVLMGNDEVIENPPYKLALTYEALAHWKKRRKRKKQWTVRKDETILRQATTFFGMLVEKESLFSPEQAEDYCFARAFGYISKDEGARRWPSLRGHESDRIEEMEHALRSLEAGGPIISKDHRVVQAIVMLAIREGMAADIVYPSSVNKSWPQFWEFVESLSLEDIEDVAGA